MVSDTEIVLTCQDIQPALIYKRPCGEIITLPRTSDANGHRLPAGSKIVGGFLVRQLGWRGCK